MGQIFAGPPPASSIPLRASEVWQKVVEAATAPDARDQGWTIERADIQAPYDSCFTTDRNGYCTGTLMIRQWATVSKTDGPYKLFFYQTYDLVSQYGEINGDTNYSVTLKDQRSGYEFLARAYMPSVALAVPCNSDGAKIMEDTLSKVLGQTVDVETEICGGYCFSSGMQLLKEDGRTTSFWELAAKASAGLALPKIASINEETAEVVYQQPTRVIDHGVSSDGILRGEGALSGLEVTPNHPIYVRQMDWKQVWKPVGDIASDDVMVNPFEGDSLSVDASSITMQSVEGAYHLFDISMPGDNAHNFLVKPPEGTEWVVAHNKQMY